VLPRHPAGQQAAAARHAVVVAGAENAGVDSISFN
jgi:hypothetical protein